jgi:D-3-phosphoglycerate dehydrogenase
MKLLLLDDIHPVFIKRVEALNIEVVKLHYVLSKTEILQLLPTYQFVVVNSKTTVDKYFLDAATQLKWIGRPGSGLENIDLEYAQQKGVVCNSSPEGNCQAVAEHALGLILSISKNIAKSMLETKQYKWHRTENTGFELQGKTIGIIGYGHTGQALAKILSSFGCNILAHDIFKHNFSNEHVAEASLQQVLDNADIISIHLPLNNSTVNYFDKAMIDKCKKEFILINTARGKIINTGDLIEAIKSKKIIGAGLDVMENELLETMTEQQKNNYNFLINQQKVIVTPHIAGWSIESKWKMANVLASKIETFINTNNLKS